MVDIENDAYVFFSRVSVNFLIVVLAVSALIIFGNSL